MIKYTTQRRTIDSDGTIIKHPKGYILAKDFTEAKLLSDLLGLEIAGRLIEYKSTTI